MGAGSVFNEGGAMKKILISTLVVGSLLTGCVAVPGGSRGHHPGSVVVAPLLPPVVVLGIEPYYFHGDFHYHYTNGIWFYSRSRRGPWIELPRDRYPKEVRFKKKDKRRDRDRYYDDRRY
jgi:hypothetical protein